MGNLVNTNCKDKLNELKIAYQRTLLRHVSYTRIIDDLIEKEHKRVMKTYKESK
jgi:hypothetical protein